MKLRTELWLKDACVWFVVVPSIYPTQDILRLLLLTTIIRVARESDPAGSVFAESFIARVTRQSDLWVMTLSYFA